MALQTNLLWTVRQLAVLLEQYGKAQMEALDLSPTQGIVLQYLLEHREREVYGVELHEMLRLSKSSVSATLKALRQKGYLRTKENPKDDRKKQILLTEKAKDAEQILQECLLSQQERLCGGIPRQRLAELAEDLDRMLRNVKQEMEAEAI